MHGALDSRSQTQTQEWIRASSTQYGTTLSKERIGAHPVIETIATHFKSANLGIYLKALDIRILVRKIRR